MNPNTQGLYRYVEATVAREVRQRSKFGCVICRSAIYTYEHFDPPFADALSHNPNGICLLCGTCQVKSSKGLLSKHTIKARYLAVQADSTIRPPFDNFDFRTTAPIIELGSAKFEGCQNLISINGTSLLQLDKSEDGSGFPTLTGLFYSEDKAEILRINRNEWIGSCDVWDMDIKGTRLVIRRKSRDVSLVLRISPPTTIVIEKLNMRYGDFHVILEEGYFMIGHVLPNREFYVGFKSFTSRGADTGIELQSIGSLPPEFQGISMNGGEGVIVHGTGITLGKHSGAMTCLGLRIEETTPERTRVLEYDFTKDLNGRFTTMKPKFRKRG